MSKKIIYLLSLLMVLSLVFASCKKNGAGDISGTIPDNSNDNSPTTENGLADSEDWLNKNSEDTIKNEPIPNFQTTGGVAYFRNPVIVVMGTAKSDVVVFAEKRYKSPGTDNDIGINGETATDIVYISSTDSGKKWGVPGIVGRASQSTGGADAVAAPVVFKVDDTTVVVVASAGAGLSRVSQNYTSRGDGSQKSQLKYTVGKYSAGSFTWSEWNNGDMTSTIESAISKASVFNTQDGKQFATHSGKGFVSGNGNNAKLYLPVTVSDQGKNGSSKEEMGNIMFIGTYNGNTVTWNEVNSSAVKFDVSGGFSQHKESRVLEASGDSANQIQYIAVGNPWYSPANDNIGYSSQSGQKPKNTIPGSEGSPSYLVVDKWYGQTGYDPTKYSTANPNKTQRLFAHVKSRISTITMYALQEANFASEGTPYTVKAYPEDNTPLAKSSSMDVLGDGTIVMVAEQGGNEREYFIVYKRFTQKFLATKLGIN